YMLTSMGELRLAIQAPDGELEPDRRAARYQVPGWVQDPFVAEDTAEGKDAEPLAGARYRLGTVLHESPRGLVTFATDMTTGHPCVLKTAFRDALAEDDGS